MNDHVKPINCRDTTHIVSDARDRTITDEEARQLQAHLLTCSYCQVAAAQFKQLFDNLDILLSRT